MSACAGLGLDNLYVDITAEEVPILDGSAASFVFLLQSAGIELQDAPKRFLRVQQAGRGARRRGRDAEVGAAGALPRLQAQLRDRVRPPGRQRHRPARRVRHGLGPLQAGDRARAHLRLHQGRRDDARARPGPRRQHGQRDRRSTTTACSTPTACATATSSSSTRSSTPSATCTSPASRCWRSYVAYKSGHALNNQLLRALLADPSAYEWSASTTNARRRAAWPSWPRPGSRRPRDADLPPGLRPAAVRRRAVLRDVHRHRPGGLAPARPRHRQVDGDGGAGLLRGADPGTAGADAL